MEYQIRYKSLDVYHLLKEELDFELFIRNIPFAMNEHDSIKRRKLKDKLKEERSLNTSQMNFRVPSEEIEQEIEPIVENVKEITLLMEKSRPNTREKQKLQTRLIHYMHRLDIIRHMRDAHKFVILLTGLEKNLRSLYTRYFTLLSDLPEVRKEVQKSIDAKIKQMSGNQKQNNSGSECTGEGTSEISDSGREIENQNIGTGKATEQEEVESENIANQADTNPDLNLENIEPRAKRKDFLERIAGLENGVEENWKEMIDLFKEFIIDVKQKQEASRKEEKRQERKMQEEKRLLKEKYSQSIKTKLEKLIKATDLKSQIKQKSDLNKETRESPKLNKTSSSSESEYEKNVKRKNGKEKTKRKLRKKSRKRKSSNGNSSSSSGSNSYNKFDLNSSDETIASTTTTTESNSSEDCFRRKHKKKKRNSSHKNREFGKVKRVSVADWRLRYDGRDNGRKLIEFLKEVKMRCVAEEVNQKELFRSAIHLFSGRAKDWLIDGIENGDFHRWKSLEKKLKREFLPPDIDYQLEMQASSRKQARGEKFVDFYHDIQKTFQSMESQLSSKRKFQIVWRNMRHEYKNALTGAKIDKNLAKLKEYGRLVDENNWYLFQRPIENPGRRKSNQIEEIATYQKQYNKQPTPNMNKTRIFQNSNLNPRYQNNNKNVPNETKKLNTEEREQKIDEPMEGSSSGTLQNLVRNYKRPAIGTCYNCRKSGHHFGECPEQRQKFCKRCGFSNVQTHLCPFCTKNETESV